MLLSTLNSSPLDKRPDGLRVVFAGTFNFSATGGGAPGRLRNLGLALMQAGQKPTLFCVGERPTVTIWQGMQVEQFGREAETGEPAWRWRRRVNDGAVDKMIGRLEEMRRAGALDVVVFYNQDVVYAWRLRRACRRMAVPFVQQYAECHLSADFAEGWRSTYFLLEALHLRLMPRCSDGAIVISEELKRIVERAQGTPALLIPTIAPLIPAAPPRRPGAALRVTCISRGARRDALPLLLQVARGLQSKSHAVTFRILGLDCEAAARVGVQAHELGVAAVVRLDGFLPDAEFAAALEESDLMMLLRTDDLSSRACFPSRLHELFSHGAPVLLSAVGDLVGYFKDGKECLLVPANDAAAVQQRIEWVLANRPAAGEIGRQGRQRAAELFAPERHGASLTRYLSSLTPHRLRLRAHEST